MLGLGAGLGAGLGSIGGSVLSLAAVSGTSAAATATAATATAGALALAAKITGLATTIVGGLVASGYGIMKTVHLSRESDKIRHDMEYDIRDREKLLRDIDDLKEQLERLKHLEMTQHGEEKETMLKRIEELEKQLEIQKADLPTVSAVAAAAVDGGGGNAAAVYTREMDALEKVNRMIQSIEKSIAEADAPSNQLLQNRVKRGAPRHGLRRYFDRVSFVKRSPPRRP